MKTKILLFALAVFTSTSLFAVTHGSIIKKTAPLDVVIDWGYGTTFPENCTVDYKIVTIGGKLWATVVGEGYTLEGNAWSSQIRLFSPEKFELDYANAAAYVGFTLYNNTTIVTAYPYAVFDQIQIVQAQDNAYNGTEIIDYNVNAPNSGLTGDTEKPLLTKADIGTQDGTTIPISCTASDNSGDYFYLVTDVANNFSYASFTDDFTVTGLTEGITYTLSVVAVDFSGNESTVESTVTGVTISPETLNITDVSSSQLTATVSPADASDKTVIWTSSNTDVATVSETGLVTGVAAGNATITVTTTSGSKTATCDATVTAHNPDNFTVTYTEGNTTAPPVSNTDLLQTLASGSTNTGFFSNNTDVLTNGDASVNTCAYDVSSITYTLNTETNILGYSISGIDVFTSWGDAGRLNPNVTVSYSFIGSPDVFQSLTTLEYSASGSGSDRWTKSSIDGGGSNIVTGVAAIKFYFGVQQNGNVGYSELDVFGTPTVITNIKYLPTKDFVYGTNNKIVVDLSSVKGSSIVTVIDTKGSIVKSLQSQGAELLNINVSNKGIYLVRVQNGEKLLTQKVILN